MVGARNAVFAEESAEVEVLFAEAKKFEELSKKMKASLTRMATSGDYLQEAIGPVYSNTQSLQMINHNVDKMLAAIEKWQKPLEGRGKEEKTIRDGPGKVGVTAYLTSLQRVDHMLSDLETKNLRVNEQVVDELGHLLRHGNGRVQDVYESILQEDIRKIEPLHYIIKQIPFPVIEQNKLSELTRINSFLSANSSRNGAYNQNESPTIHAYVDARGNYLSSSLENLAAASISTSRKKTKDEIYRHGTSGIGTYASGLEGMLIAEWQNVTSIFVRENWSSVFEKTTRKAVEEFSKTVHGIETQIKSSIITDCFLAFEIIDIVNRLALEVDSQTGQLKHQLFEAIRPVRETAKSSIYELLGDVRRRTASMASFPLDGAAVAFTIEVMTRLQNLVTYPSPVASILISIGDGNWSSSQALSNGSSSSLPTIKSLDVGGDGTQLIAHYVLDTIETLLSSLESKSRIILKTKALQGVFMANNVAVIDRMIRSSDLQPFLTSAGSPSKVDVWRKKGTAAYLDSWREPCNALMDVQYTNRNPRPPSGNSGSIDSAAVIKGLSSKDKDVIKEKFKTFNTRFDELSTKHRELGHGMEKDVKNQLAREIQAMIEPLYARFWDRYHEIDKGKGKYVKFDKSGLATQLSSLG